MRFSSAWTPHNGAAPVCKALHLLKMDAAFKISINFSRATSAWLCLLFAIFAVVVPLLTSIDFDIPSDQVREMQIKEFVFCSVAALVMFFNFKQILFVQVCLVLLTLYFLVFIQFNWFITIIMFVLTSPILLFPFKCIGSKSEM